MRKERDDERRRRLEAIRRESKVAQERREQLEKIYKDLCALFSVSNPRERGLFLEDLVNRLFKTGGILIRESFRRAGEVGQGIIEQIDGVVDLDGEIYLVEMKWLKDKVGIGDVSQHLVRVFTRGSSFEAALHRLEEVLESLEHGNLNLEESVKAFEEGVGLVRFCHGKLDEVERRVELLLKDEAGRFFTKPFPEEEE
jgi:exodeoxyribonuclease VII small subunit